VRLAEVYAILRRYDESSRFLGRAKISLASLTERPDRMGLLHRRIGEVYALHAQWAEVEQAAKASLAAFNSSSPAPPLEVASSQLLMAESFAGRKQWQPAAAAARQALAERQRELAPDHPDVAHAMTALGYYVMRSGRDDEAIAILQKAKSILRSLWGDETDTYAEIDSYLGAILLARGDYDRAASTFNAAIAAASRASRRAASMQVTRGGATDNTIGQPGWFTTAIANLVVTAYERQQRMTANTGYKDAEAALLAYQRLQDPAVATALRQMSLRLARNDGRLGELVRERQDLAQSWRGAGNALAELLARDAAGHDQSLKDQYRDRMSSTQARIAAIDEQLSRQFREFADLAFSNPVGVAGLASLLDDNEIAIVIGDIAQDGESSGVYIWIIDRHRRPLWVRSKLTSAEITTAVQTLRCGLDALAWSGAGALRCSSLVPTAPGEPTSAARLPFDLTRSHELYTALFGDIEHALRNADGTWKDIVLVRPARLQI
jgi:tetratricopeptide (TPR) repeat protein